MRGRSVLLVAMTVAVAGVALPWLSRALVRQDCESMPLPMFHFRGVTYLPHTIDDSMQPGQLGEVLAVQKDDMPAGLSRCENVRLKEGQGSLPPGSQVYAIDGVDTSVAIAVDFGTGYLALWAPDAATTTVAGG